mgnify:FL=1
MAINYSVEILVDSSVSADKRTELVRKILHVLQGYTRTTTYAATYAAGTTSKNQDTITVGGASPDLGIRVVFDTAAIGTDITPIISSKIRRILDPETLTIAHSSTGAYVLGDRVYNCVITLT